MEDVLAHSQPLVVDDKLRGLVPFLPLNVPPPAAVIPPAPASSASVGSHPMNRITIAGLALVVVLAIVASATCSP